MLGDDLRRALLLEGDSSVQGCFAPVFGKESPYAA